MNRTEAADLLRGDLLSDGERSAIGLLIEHRDAFWFTRDRPCVRLLDASADPRLDWRSGLETWSRRLGEPCDRAVLITALHLGGAEVPGESLGPWWTHLDRQALASVLRALATIAGARADVSDVGDAPLRPRVPGR